MLPAHKVLRGLCLRKIKYRGLVFLEDQISGYSAHGSSDSGCVLPADKIVFVAPGRSNVRVYVLSAVQKSGFVLLADQTLL